MMLPENWRWADERLGWRPQRLDLNNADRKYLIDVLWAPPWLYKVESEATKYVIFSRSVSLGSFKQTSSY